MQMMDVDETGTSSGAGLDTKSRNKESGTTESAIILTTCTRKKDEFPKHHKSTTSNQETTDDPETEDRLLVVYCRSGRLGAAYYTLQTGELFVLDEIVDRPPEHQILCSLFRQVCPALLLLDGKAPAGCVSVTKSLVFADSSSNEDAHCKLQFISSKDYNYEACRRRVLSLSLAQEPAQCSGAERAVFLRTVLDLAQALSVHALGALLRHLDLHWANLSLNLYGKPEFLSLKRISLADIVCIDEDTYSGLQVFSALAHPAGLRRGAQGSAREGLSLYQLLGKCASRLGHAALRVLMRHPSSDLATLQRRLDVVEFFTRPENDCLMRNICSSLRYIRNVNGILAKIKALSAKPYQWKALYNTLYHAVLICELCEGAGEGKGEGGGLLRDLAHTDIHHLYEMALSMNRIIDFELSKTEGKFTVKAGVDPDLDLKKQTLASLRGLMSETAKVELARLPECVQECSMLYLPHLGYLLGVRAWRPHLTPSQKQLPNMEFMFQNDDYIHYKSKGCQELDVMIGDTYPEIVAHETRIMMRLAALLLQHLHTLHALVDKCAHLDCLIAMAKVAKEMNFVRPILTTEKLIRIKQGRHPLYAASWDALVPNDAESSLEAGLVKIITGPNASGKSVYLKQTGLIVYLAHIGSFVPAAAAEIGLISHIFSRIKSTECVAAHMSAFLIDLRQMAQTLRECRSASLVLVDEFGKGTAEGDGRALLAACLSALLVRARRCPHALLATHFLDIKHYILDTPLVTFLRMETVVRGGEAVALHRVVAGCAGSSLAHQVAGAAGGAGGAGLARLLPRADTVAACAKNNSLPPPDNVILSKMNAVIEIMKSELADI